MSPLHELANCVLSLLFIMPANLVGVQDICTVL